MAFNRINIDRLDGGQNTGLPPNKIAANQLVRALNLEYDRKDNLASRTGVGDVLVEAEVSTSVKGIVASAELNDPQKIVVGASKAYVSNQAGSSISVFDVTNPDSVVPLGSFADSDVDAPVGLALAEADGLLFVVNSGSSDKLVILDVSDPANIVKRSSLGHASLNSAKGVALFGDYAFVTGYDSDSLIVFDVSDPDSPSAVGSLVDATNLNGAFGIALSSDGNTAFVGAALGDRLTVVDVTAKSSPSVTGSVTDATDLDGPISLVYVESLQHCFVTAHSATSTKVTSVDVSTPATPTVADSVDFANGTASSATEAGGLWYDGGLLFVVTDKGDELVILNASQPSSLNILNRIQNAAVLVQPNDLALDDDNNAYVINNANDSFVVVAISPSAEIEEVGTPLQQSGDDWDIIRLDPDDSEKLWAYDNTNSSLLELKGTLTAGPSLVEEGSSHPDTPTAAAACLFEPSGGGKYLAIGGLDGSTVIFWIYNLAGKSLAVQSKIPTGGAIRGMTFNDDVLFMVHDASSTNAIVLSAWDVSNPNAPKEISNLAFDTSLGDYDNPHAFSVLDKGNGLLFWIEDVSAADDIIHVADVSDPTNMAIVNSQTVSAALLGDAQDMALHPTEQILYIAFGNLAAFSYTTGGVLTLEGFTNGLGNSETDVLAVGSSGQFIAAGTRVNASNLYFYSLSDPLSPFLVATYSSSNIKGSFVASTSEKQWPDDDGLALVPTLETVSQSNTRRELVVLDARRLTLQALRSSAVTVPMESPKAVVSDGVYAYVASDASDSIVVVNVEDISQPTVVGSVSDATALNNAEDLVLDGDFLYVVGGSGVSTGVFCVVDVSDKANPAVRGSITSSTMDGARDVAHVAGSDYVYVVTEDDRFVIIDVSDTDTPSIVGSLQDASALGSAAGVAVANGETRAFTMNDDTLVTINISLKTTPVVANEFTDATFDDGRRLRWESDTLYVASFANDKVAVVDVSDPDDPAVLGSITSTGNQFDGPWGLWKEPGSDRVFVAGFNSSSISVLDVTDKSAPTVLQSFQDTSNLASIPAVWGRGAAAFGVSSTNDRMVAVAFQGLPLANAVTSIFQFFDGTAYRTVITAGTSLYELDLTTGEITNITGAVGIADAQAPWQWREYDASAYGTNGEVMVQWDGTGTFSLVASAPDSPRYIEVWNNRIFVVSGSVVYFSDLGQPDFSGGLSGSIEVSSGNDGDLTGIYAHKGFLFLFKRNRIWRIQTAVPNTDETRWSRELVSGNLGCISAFSIQTVLDDVLFLSGSGVMSLRVADTVGDFESLSVSLPISELRDVSQQEELYPSVVDDLRSQYWISIPASGTQTTFCLDFKRGMPGRWTEFEGKVVGDYYAQVLDDAGDKQILIAGDNTIYRRKRDSDDDPYSDAGDAYSKILLSAEYDFNEASNRKKANRWGFVVQKLTATLTLSTDLLLDSASQQSESFVLDSLSGTLPVQRKVHPVRALRTLQFQMTNSGKEGFVVESLFVDIKRLTHKRVGAA